mgnify:FL=1
MDILIVFILALPIKPGFVRRTSISTTSILLNEAEEFLLLFETGTAIEDRCKNSGVKGTSKNCGKECMKLLLLGPTAFGGGGASAISSEIKECR